MPGPHSASLQQVAGAQNVSLGGSGGIIVLGQAVSASSRLSGARRFIDSPRRQGVGDLLQPAGAFPGVGYDFGRLVSLLTALLLLAADDAQKAADAHFTRGLSLAGRGDYVASLAEFEEAYRLAPAWQVLFNLGVVHEKLAEPVAAVEAFEAYLAQGGGAVP